ncbi:hypothetical protein, partial [Parabacteroides sp.]|uniref:hypothetical protein n=1 Tax=Parabacteroides sp. TaxID=1869337 RepID=UPI00257AE483
IIFIYNVCDPVCGGIPPHAGSLRLEQSVLSRKGHPGRQHDTLSREWRGNPCKRHFGSLSVIRAFRPEKGGFDKSVTVPCTVRHCCLSGDGLFMVR